MFFITQLLPSLDTVPCRGALVPLDFIEFICHLASIGLILSLSVLALQPLFWQSKSYIFHPIVQIEPNLVKILWSLVVMLVASIGSKYLRTILRNQLLLPFDFPRNAEFLLLCFIHVCIFADWVS